MMREEKLMIVGNAVLGVLTVLLVFLAAAVGIGLHGKIEKHTAEQLQRTIKERDCKPSVFSYHGVATVYKCADGTEVRR